MIKNNRASAMLCTIFMVLKGNVFTSLSSNYATKEAAMENLEYLDDYTTHMYCEEILYFNYSIKNEAYSGLLSKDKLIYIGTLKLHIDNLYLRKNDLFNDYIKTLQNYTDIKESFSHINDYKKHFNIIFNKFYLLYNFILFDLVENVKLGVDNNLLTNTIIKTNETFSYEQSINEDDLKQHFFSKGFES